MHEQKFKDLLSSTCQVITVFFSRSKASDVNIAIIAHFVNFVKLMYFHHRSCMKSCIKLCLLWENSIGLLKFAFWKKSLHSHFSLHDSSFHFFTFIEFQVITELLPGDQVYVVAEGFLDDSADNRYQADGYTSFTGVQIRSGIQ